VKTLEIDLRLDVTRGVDLAVHRDQRDAEDVRIHLGQGGDVVRVGALAERHVLLVGRAQRLLDVRRALRRHGERAGDEDRAGDRDDRGDPAVHDLPPSE
jgi:hypothetical protein